MKSHGVAYGERGGQASSILVNCSPSGEMHNYCIPHIIKEHFENFLIHRCKYILLSEVYCVWQVVKPRQSFLITLFYDFLILRVQNCVSRRYQVIGSSGMHRWPLFFRRCHNQKMLYYKTNSLSLFKYFGQPLSVPNYNSISSFLTIHTRHMTAHTPTLLQIPRAVWRLSPA